MKKYILIVLSFFLLLSCNQSSPFEGYKKSKKGFYYKLETIGETNEKIKVGDYITVDIIYSTIADSVFFEGRRKIKLEEPVYRGAIEDCFMTLCNKESASYILLAEPFFLKTLESNLPSFIHADDFFKVKVSVVDVQTETVYGNEKQAFLHWTEDFGDYERVLLQQYISEEKLSVKPTKSGLIYLPLESGEGNKIELGDTITVHYEGIFLNGKYFDSTKRRKQPFQFVYGTEWQVIEGLEEGLAYMREGDRALFIVPSELAFGASGSSTGIVPPFTSLIFEVDVLSVKNGVIKQ